ncbi:MAG: hypothetical protein OEW15_17795 [Nitrospirota bacterium]|nr:hypothetical protein [Nitrospirota bacterium]
MRMFSFVDPAQPMTMIDVFLEEILPFKDIEKELARIQAKGITIPVISLRHLKELKKRAGRPQDLADIETIETMEKEDR